MKKIFLSLTAGVFLLGSVFAESYSMPALGENIFFLAHPELLTGGLSSAGGGILSVSPSSTMLNPALGALEERVSIDFGYTGAFNSSDVCDKYGQAFTTGILIPTDWAIFTGGLEGVFANTNTMVLGKTLNFRGSASKQIMDNLYVGLGLVFGFGWDSLLGSNSGDWSLAADIGALYNFGDVAFLKNFRVAASANNLGKTYTYGRDFISGIPSFMTLRAGAAAELIDMENFSLGLSFDVTTPMFRNLIIDSGVQVRICNFVKLYSSWEYNFYEADHDINSWLPTVGLVFKFNIGMGGSDFVKKNDWSSSELCPSAGWKNVDEKVNLFSAGAVLRLGQRDTSGPDIEMD